MSDVYEIYECKGAFGSDKRVLKNGKAVNEFGLLKDIQKLQAENSELKKQSQWISVDSPPALADSGKWVAVNVLCEDAYVRVYDFNVDSGKWMHGLDKVISKPIKWLPLPAPPEGE